MTDEERNKKLADALVLYGRPFIIDIPLKKRSPKVSVLGASMFPHQKRPFNV